MGRVVYETENFTDGNSSRSIRDRVVLPAPEGEEMMTSNPRSLTRAPYSTF
jgi:hypothetical protein